MHDQLKDDIRAWAKMHTYSVRFLANKPRLRIEITNHRQVYPFNWYAAVTNTIPTPLGTEWHLTSGGGTTWRYSLWRDGEDPWSKPKQANPEVAKALKVLRDYDIDVEKQIRILTETGHLVGAELFQRFLNDAEAME